MPTVNCQKSNVSRKGFTLIEVLVVIGILAILATIVIVAVNPARQFAQSRNTQRTANVSAILNAVGERVADNKGIFETGCTAGAIPTASSTLKTGGYDIGPCLVPTYLSSLPFDPTAPGAHFTSAADYNSGYFIQQDATTGRITVSATGELGEQIAVTR